MCAICGWVNQKKNILDKQNTPFTYTITVKGDIDGDGIAGDIDALYLPTDNLVASCIPIVSKISLDKKIPVVSWDADIVKKGALGYYTMNYYDLGKLTARQADKVLKKEVKIENMPIEYQKNVNLVINEEVAKQLGINIPDELKGGL